jgi:hypothetical protein
MSGPAPELIRTIANTDFFENNINFSKQRAADLNAAANILAFEFHGEPVDTKKSRLDYFTFTTNDQRDQLELAGRRAVETLDDMASIFLPKDKVLKAAGLIPVYYWFVRKQPPKHYLYIREFLVRFEDERRDIYTTLPDNLARFNQLNRSTNDVQSHNGRLKILRDEYKKYISNIKISSER